MAKTKESLIPLLVTVGLLGWLVPGAGYFFIGQRKRAILIFTTITLVFVAGIYVGSIGVIDPVRAKLWYLAQILTTPAVLLLGQHTSSGAYPVYGHPAEIGQIYTSVAGLLNLLVIVNALYLAYTSNRQQGEC